MLRRIRRSGRVTLVLIGVAAMGGCGRGDDTRRDVYRTRDDCLADWGNKAEDCQPASDERHRSLGYFYGPSYLHHAARSGATWTATNSPRAIGSTGSAPGITRGGFGSSGRSASG